MGPFQCYIGKIFFIVIVNCKCNEANVNALETLKKDVFFLADIRIQPFSEKFTLKMYLICQNLTQFAFFAPVSSIK